MKFLLKIFWFLVVIFAIANSEDAIAIMEKDSQFSIRIELSALKNSIELGQPFRFVLLFENTDENAFFIEKTLDIGENDLKLVARKDNCTYELGNVHYDRNVSGIKFSYVPLESGDKFMMNLMPINDISLWAIPMINIRSPGQYHFTVKYTSKNSGDDAPVAPVWRGQIDSNSTIVEVLPADQKRVSTFLERLEKCISNFPSIDEEAIQYFKIVRDPRAAELLTKLLRLDPGGPFTTQIAESLAAQGRQTDAKLFQQISENTKLDGSTKNYLLRLAEDVNQKDRCN